MINKLLITDISYAESYAYGGRNEYDVWISVVDEEDRHKIQRMERLFTKKNISHFHRLFFDWSDEDQDSRIQERIEQLGPSQKDVDNIITFLTPLVNDNKVHNLGINCFAGISRSTAVGIIALVIAGKTPKIALDYVLSIRSQAWPNLRMLRLASNTLGQDLYSPVKEWKDSSKSNIYIPQGGWHW